MSISGPRRRPTIFVILGHQPSAFLEQQLHHRLVPAHCSPRQRRLTIIVILGFQLRAFLEQQLHHNSKQTLFWARKASTVVWSREMVGWPGTKASDSSAFSWLNAAVAGKGASRE
jgi:hypothetical protein